MPRTSGKLVFIVCVALLTLSVMTAAQEPVTLQFVYWNNSGTAYDVYKQLFDEFHAENPDIKVEILHISYSDISEKLPVLVAGGRAPDVSILDPKWSWGMFGGGIFEDLNPYIENDPLFSRDDFMPQGFEMWSSPNGELFALPFDFSIAGLFYNEYLFDEAGIEYPSEAWTWEDDFMTAATKLTQKLPDGTRTQWGYYGDTKWLLPFYALGGNLFNDDLSEILINSSESTSAIEWIARMQPEGAQSVQPTTSELSDRRMAFVTGQVAMLAEGGYFSERANNVQDANLQYNSQHLPQGAWTKARATTLGGSGVGMLSSTPHPEEAWRLLRYMTDFKVQAMGAEILSQMPVRYDVGLSDYFIKPNQPPTNMRIFVDAVDYARFYPRSPVWSNLESVMNQHLNNVWNGSKSAVQALTNIKEIWESILQEAGR